MSSTISSSSRLPYGSWPSPITSHFIAEKRIRITEIAIGGTKEKEMVYWIERRPTENGRNVICGYNLQTQEKSDITPAGMNSRSTVHEYGGGDFCPVFPSSSTPTPSHRHQVLTIDHSSKNIKLLNFQENVFKNITPPDAPQMRYGDITVDPLNRGYIYAIREDHTNDVPSQVVNSIVAIPFPQNPQESDDWNSFSPTLTSQQILTNELQDPSIMYSTPKIHSSGKLICWKEWSHPNMPWNESAIFVGLLSSDGGRILSKRKIAGGPNENVSHPRWVPNENDDSSEYSLVFFSDIDSGWSNIQRATLVIENPSTLTSLEDESVLLSRSPLLIATGYDFDSPQWNLGTKYFDFIFKDGQWKLVCIWHDQNHNMFAVICNPFQTHTLPLSQETIASPTDLLLLPVPSISSDPSQPIHLTTCSSLQVAEKSTLILLSGSPQLPLSIYRWDITQPDSISLLQSSIPLDSLESIPHSYISTPQHITFPTYSDPSLEGLNREYVAHGWYYPPTHPVYAPSDQSPSSTPPPLLVMCHGGPTGSAKIEYRLDIQYFTSRGIAVLDVNYTGSTGYGREYRQRLTHMWGVYDRKDCVYGVKYLVSKGLADEKRVAIDGTSAGGYTTLTAITIEEEKVFTAATSSYGIGDLTLLLSDTHKLESHYLTQLIGPADTHFELYQSRSPINFIQNIQCSLLLLQGIDDRVVPPNQAKTMYESVKERGIPTALVLFEGEGHGWRKAENIKRALRLELSFYGAVFGFVPEVGEREDVPLVNLNLNQEEGKH